jgi:hypothetical protein
MKKKRNNTGRSQGSSGLMMGMRRGFKKAARSVTGQEKAPPKKNKLWDWALTVVTVALAAYVIWKFFLQ